ncbi:aldose 1-epimerase [Lentiprolixibacter aurantiacus]|uniref:Aldose 1-epimerase n=1 Tax=Lentiprolixibacter aurantiacus TaxID=2993939 RepID=A0AAE3MNU2_9FLAO|nr:aldose 1-epimerase [Lentiprolixibacter aurantiacus]MCX2720623.1 aldose 1-epimerase [Lentiprolixibacter aurantiacus]
MDILKSGNHTVRIDQGELVGYSYGKFELIHQKGQRGWGHSDTEMFPIIGPTADTAYRVQVPKGNAIQDQHGLLRELDYEQVSVTENSASYRKSYTAGTVVKNSKYPDRSPMQYLIWPYSFEFTKTFELTYKGLTVSFEIKGEADMPYMLGYHPAFNLITENPRIEAGEHEITLGEVMQAGSRALEIPNACELVLQDQCRITVKTNGFDNFMLWTEVPNMLCIEPVTYYPNTKSQQFLHEGFDYLSREGKLYTVHIIPQ